MTRLEKLLIALVGIIALLVAVEWVWLAVHMAQ